VGIRRLRSALRSFRAWAPLPPPELVAGLRSLFDTLGRCRDSDVLGVGVMAELAKVGAPPLRLQASPDGPDPVEAVMAPDTQGTFVAWIIWRAALGQEAEERPGTVALPAEGARAAGGAEPADAAGSEVEATTRDGEPAEANSKQPARDRRPTFQRNVERQLRRWHGRIAVDWKAFDELDETSLHALRKRIKRQRYAVEFFAPVLRRRRVERYLNPLAAIQDRMGELNDLFVARAQYQSLVVSDPAAWFALGWLAARIAEVRALAKPELGRLAKLDSPAN